MPSLAATRGCELDLTKSFAAAVRCKRSNPLTDCSLLPQLPGFSHLIHVVGLRKAWLLHLFYQVDSVRGTSGPSAPVWLERAQDVIEAPCQVQAGISRQLLASSLGLALHFFVGSLEALAVDAGWRLPHARQDVAHVHTNGFHGRQRLGSRGAAATFVVDDAEACATNGLSHRQLREVQAGALFQQACADFLTDFRISHNLAESIDMFAIDCQ